MLAERAVSGGGGFKPACRPAGSRRRRRPAAPKNRMAPFGAGWHLSGADPWAAMSQSHRASYRASYRGSYRGSCRGSVRGSHRGSSREHSGSSLCVSILLNTSSALVRRVACSTGSAGPRLRRSRPAWCRGTRPPVASSRRRHAWTRPSRLGHALVGRDVGTPATQLPLHRSVD
jgi:hypothetical protein